MALTRTIDPAKLDRDALKAAAASYHTQGFNCAQAVACALVPAVGMDADTAFRMTEGFGAGMGGMTETCGAISGAVTVLGMANSRGMEDPTSKGSTYKLSKDLVARFSAKNGTTVCRELKGIGSDAGPRRSCPGCIDDAVDLAVDILSEQARASEQKLREKQARDALKMTPGEVAADAAADIGFTALFDLLS